jgi:hypothetical protein
MPEKLRVLTGSGCVALIPLMACKDGGDVVNPE